jgi:hypothetical protein
MWATRRPRGTHTRRPRCAAAARAADPARVGGRATSRNSWHRGHDAAALAPTALTAPRTARRASGTRSPRATAARRQAHRHSRGGGPPASRIRRLRVDVSVSPLESIDLQDKLNATAAPDRPLLAGGRAAGCARTCSTAGPAVPPGDSTSAMRTFLPNRSRPGLRTLAPTVAGGACSRVVPTGAAAARDGTSPALLACRQHGHGGRAPNGRLQRR